MAENDSGSAPTQSDLQAWATQYGLSTPVLSDPGWTSFDTLWNQNYTPANMLLAPGMQVVQTEWVSEGDIAAVVPL
jgi:hypothetical protein